MTRAERFWIRIAVASALSAVVCAVWSTIAFFAFVVLFCIAMRGAATARPARTRAFDAIEGDDLMRRLRHLDPARALHPASRSEKDRKAARILPIHRPHAS